MTVPPADTQEALDAHYCPICDVRFEADDRCATDIELGTCHATCLEGSPTVDLETGEPIDGPIETYPYSGAYNGSSLLSDPIDRVTTSSGGREAEASPPLATTRAPGEGEAVKVLDLSNLLKHAFDYGMATSGGTASQIADWWPTYDPEDCPAFNRIKSALAGPSYAQPDKLPCDVQLPGVLLRRGIAFSTLLLALDRRKDWDEAPREAEGQAALRAGYTDGHCAEKAKPGGCQLYNLHCGYPDCDRLPAAPKRED